MDDHALARPLSLAVACWRLGNAVQTTASIFLLRAHCSRPAIPDVVPLGQLPTCLSTFFLKMPSRSRRCSLASSSHCASISAQSERTGRAPSSITRVMRPSRDCRAKLDRRQWPVIEPIPLNGQFARIPRQGAPTQTRDTRHLQASVLPSLPQSVSHRQNVWRRHDPPQRQLPDRCGHHDTRLRKLGCTLSSTGSPRA